MNENYLKNYRLLSKNDFLSLREGSRFLRKKTILLYYKKNDLNNSRLGIAVSKKFGKAVRRNSFKRYVREVFRKSEFKNSNFDVLVVSNNRYFQKDLVLSDSQVSDLRSDVNEAFLKITKSE